MKSILVSTSVFARIWALRESGEENENDILERVLLCGGVKNELKEVVSSQNKYSVGHCDKRYGVVFQGGFEVFCNYIGTDFSARATSDGWVLVNDGKTYRTLNEMSKAIGAKSENAWINWFFRGGDGSKIPINELRDRKKVGKRESRRIDSDRLLAESE